jgi:hypothetical protein
MAAAGQWIDSPSGRIARAHEIDAAWQNLWQAEYTSHVDEGLRAEFTEDYQTWQRIKEQLAQMGVLSLMSPATGDLLDRWAVRSRDWYERFKEHKVPIVAPAPIPRLEPGKSGWEGPTKFAWSIAGLVASGAVLAAVTWLATRNLKQAAFS